MVCLSAEWIESSKNIEESVSHTVVQGTCNDLHGVCNGNSGLYICSVWHHKDIEVTEGRDS